MFKKLINKINFELLKRSKICMDCGNMQKGCMYALLAMYIAPKEIKEIIEKSMRKTYFNTVSKED